MILKHGMNRHGPKLYIICIDDKTMLTLTKFTARSKLVFHAFMTSKRSHMVKLLMVDLGLKSNRKAMNRSWNNQKANPALKTEAGNK